MEGLVHVSEMSWTKKNVHPGKIVSTSQEVEVMVLDVDPDKRRISLGLKQCLGNPWELFQEQHPAGSTVEGEIRNITEFGLFVGLDNDIDGMVHLSDLAGTSRPRRRRRSTRRATWSRRMVLDVDVEKERISLGIKQLTEDPFQEAIGGLKRGVARHLRGQRGDPGRHRGEDHRRRRPASSARRSCRATGSSSAPTASPSARRSTPRSPPSTAPTGA